MEDKANLFEKLRKYDVNNPAAFNKEVLLLAEESKENLLYIQHYLKNNKGNYDELYIKLGIKATKHPNLPLIIFNYEHVSTPHDSLIGLECRGLVLKSIDWKVVAKPMNRFFNWGEIDIQNSPHPNFEKNKFNFDNFITQSKEDGSLMVLYNYNDIWMLNTRTYFLNKVGKTKIIMSGINEVYVDDVMNTFISALDNPNIKSLDSFDKFLNKDCTYSFEFCSNFNKIVRTYSKDTIFLLSISNNITLKEYDIAYVNRFAVSIGASRPKDYNLKTFDQIMKAMKDVINKDPSLEGFVIVDNFFTRWKIKSPSYFFLHHIAYDQMRTPLPKDLVPLIIQGEGTELFSILEINGFKAELFEVQKQWKFCESRLNQHFQLLKQEYELLINLSKEDFDFKLKDVKTPLSDIIKYLYENKKNSLSDLEEQWLKNPYFLVEKLFSEKERNPINLRTAELSITHISKYKKNVMPNLKNSKEILEKDDLWWKKIEEEYDGVACTFPSFENNKWLVFCYCGKEMNLFSVPEHIYNYKCARSPKCIYCKESIIDKKKKDKKLNSRSSHCILTYQCECGLAHRAHQNQKAVENERKRRPLRGKPLGLPCSDLCLTLRHRVHEEIDQVMKEFNFNLDQIYKEASKFLDVNSEMAHIGIINISQCKILIESFQNMRGINI